MMWFYQVNVGVNYSLLKCIVFYVVVIGQVVSGMGFGIDVGGNVVNYVQILVFVNSNLSWQLVVMVGICVNF